MATDPHDGFFKSINRDPSGPDRAHARQERLAERVIKQTLTAAGYVPRGGWLPLVNDCRGRYAAEGLTFEWFHDKFHAFPIRLGCEPVDFVHAITLRVLMDGFLKTKFFEAYKRFLLATQLDDQQTQVAFVFREVNRLMVLHNVPRLHDTDEPDDKRHDSTRVIHQFKGTTYCLEIYDKFLASLGAGWLQDCT